jgi:hypothetical protein
MSLGFQCSAGSYVILWDMPLNSLESGQTIWCCNKSHNRNKGCLHPCLYKNMFVGTQRLGFIVKAKLYNTPTNAHLLTGLLI